MGFPAKTPCPATRADLDAVPPTVIAELINGELYVFSLPAPRHAYATSRLGVKLGGPFDLGEGGPGGWRILDEPELEFGPKGAEDVLVPDLAGWRIRRTLEVFALGASRKWTMLDVHQGEKRVRAEPFNAVELDLSVLWPTEEDGLDEDDEDSDDITPVPTSRSKRMRPKARNPERKEVVRNRQNLA